MKRARDGARALNHLGMALAALGRTAESRLAYRETLSTAMAAQATPDTLQALIGLAALSAQERRYEAAFELVVAVQYHAASRTETRNQAAKLRADLLAHLSAQAIDTAMNRVRWRSLDELVGMLCETREGSSID